MVLGLVQSVPPLVEVENITCSWLRPSRPSAHESTIWLVASTPVGAPLAMSTLGDGPRSSRAPAMPSSTHRPMDGSKALHRSVAGNRRCALVQWRPPSNDLAMMWKPVPGNPKANWYANTYATPLLSVRIVQPDRPKPWGVTGLLVAGVIWCVVQLSPPSVDVATTSGCDLNVGLRKAAEQT